MRSVVVIGALCASVFGAGGCTFVPGAPMAWLTAEVTVASDDFASRQLDDGSVRTSQDLRLEGFAVSVDVAGVELSQAATDVEILSFDPANPPPGYSLCHNGHCHHDSGDLVDYADIEAELNGGVATGLGTLSTLSDVVPVDVHDASEVVDASCGDRCMVGEVRLTGVNVALAQTRLQGRVYDRRTPSRLPEEGVDLDVTLPATTLSLLLAEELITGPTEPAFVDVQVGLLLDKALLDGITVDDLLAGDDAVASALAADDSLWSITTSATQTDAE